MSHVECACAKRERNLGECERDLRECEREYEGHSRFPYKTNENAHGAVEILVKNIESIIKEG